MMSRSIECILRDEIFAELEIEYPDDRDTNLLDQGIDSVNFIKLIVSIESKFNIAIPDEELLFENFSTTRLILHYLTEKAVT
jgi:D-alanine--poly(phosphoribitol) ligase subunit 2